MKLTLMYYVLLLLLMFPVSENNVHLLQEITKKKRNIECLKKNPLASFALKAITSNSFFVRSSLTSLTVSAVI